LTKQQISSAYP